MNIINLPFEYINMFGFTQKQPIKSDLKEVNVNLS